MENVIINLSSNDYRHLINVLADLPNRSNTYGLIVNIEQQVAAQMQTDETQEQDIVVEE
jgi:hypothetical protein